MFHILECVRGNAYNNYDKSSAKCILEPAEFTIYVAIVLLLSSGPSVIQISDSGPEGLGNKKIKTENKERKEQACIIA